MRMMSAEHASMLSKWIACRRLTQESRAIGRGRRTEGFSDGHKKEGDGRSISTCWPVYATWRGYTGINGDERRQKSRSASDEDDEEGAEREAFLHPAQHGQSCIQSHIPGMRHSCSQNQLPLSEIYQGPPPKVHPAFHIKARNIMKGNIENKRQTKCQIPSKILQYEESSTVYVSVRVQVKRLVSNAERCS